MSSKYLLVGIFVLLATGAIAFHGEQITGFIVSDYGKINVQLSIENGNKSLTYNLELTPRDSAFDALKRVAVVDYRIFSNGIYITAINGIKQKDGHYWFYFVNGKAPNIGCDYYHPRDGDSIVFRYVSGKEASKYL